MEHITANTQIHEHTLEECESECGCECERDAPEGQNIGGKMFRLGLIAFVMERNVGGI